MPCRHFSREERCELRGLLRTGMTQRQIAATLGRDSGAVSREIAKGGGRTRYAAKAAECETRQCGTSRKEPRLLR